MKELTVGIVACASMREQIQDCLASLEGSFRVYPIIPSCTFSVKIDLLKHYLDRSTSENDVTLLAYGICHPQILPLLAEYGDRVVKVEGNNCYEMFLGSEKYAEYHKKCYWMLSKPFFTKWKSELLTGFGAGTSNGRALLGDAYKKLVYLRLEKDELSIDLVEDFARAVGLEYEIHSADTANLKRLLEEALASARSAEAVRVPKSPVKHPRESEMRTMIENIAEVIYKVDVHTKQFTFVSPQVKTILGYTPAEFLDIMNDHLQAPFYHEDDRERVVAGRYKFLVRCLNEGMQEPYEAEYRVKHKNGDVLWVMESVYPSYSSDGIIESFVGKIVDITKRKRMEEILRESEERFRALTESTSDWVWEVDTDGVYTYASPKVRDLLGYEPEEVIGKTPFDLMPPEEAKRIAEEFRAIVESQRPFARLENTNLHKDGRLVVLETGGVPVFGADGQLCGYRGIDRDITERKRVEEELESSRDYLEKLTDSMWDAVFSVKMPERVIEWANDSFRLIGYEPEECIGKTTQFLYPDERGFFTFGDKLKSAIAEGKDVLHTEQLLKRKNGEVFPAEITTTFFKKKGKVVRVTSIIRDITERKRMEEALRESEAKYSALVEQARDGVVIVQDEVCKFANFAMTQISGYAVEEILGMHLMNMGTESADVIAQRYKSHMAGEEVPLLYEAKIRCKDGTIKEVEVSGRIVQYQGRPALMGFVRDITERKKLDQLKDDFIGLVSHELRSPLTVITGAVNTVLTEGARLSPDETRQLLKDAALEADSLSHLLGNLLELSRVQANRLFLDAEAISVKKLIQDTVEEMKSQSSEHQFIVHLPRKTPAVYADQLRVERILYNLLENAVKYSPQGGEIRVSVKPERGDLVIGVSDQGVGISLADQAKLFAPFQRLEESRLERGRGLGLGLLVCRRLVEAHGGRIWIESEPSRGSTFLFTLPLAHTLT